VRKQRIGYTAGKGTGKGGAVMSKTKYRFTYDEDWEEAMGDDLV